MYLKNSQRGVAYLPAQKSHTADLIVRPTIPELLNQKDNRRKKDNSTINSFTCTKADIDAEEKNHCRPEKILSNRIFNRIWYKDHEILQIPMDWNYTT